MKEKQLVVIAKIIKPHGILGNLKIKPFTENLEQFSNYQEFFIQGEGEKLTVNGVKPLNGFMVISFNNIDTIEKAENYRGKLLEIDRDKIVENKNLESDGFLIDDLIGFEVSDNNGINLGFIDSYYEGGYSGLYLVKVAKESSTKKNQDFFIPCNMDFFKKIDKKNRLIILKSDN